MDGGRENEEVREGSSYDDLEPGAVMLRDPHDNQLEEEHISKLPICQLMVRTLLELDDEHFLRRVIEEPQCREL